jgi:hypothetical protein
MYEELENFQRNQVWELVEPPPNCHPIRTKWVWKNKEGENGMVVRNKLSGTALGVPFNNWETPLKTCKKDQGQTRLA